MPAPTDTTTTYNQDVVGMVRRMDDFTTELIYSQSANVHDMSTPDQERLAAYISATRVYMAWVNGSPQLDLPETSPKLYELPPAPVVPTIENASIQDAVRLWTVARGELVNSQSARRTTGLLHFDTKRITAVIDKLESLLVDYISKVQPLDLPESSPEAGVTGPGRMGV